MSCKPAFYSAVELRTVVFTRAKTTVLNQSKVYQLILILVLTLGVGNLMMPWPVIHAQGTGTTYTIQPGDTLYGVAQRFGTTVAAIQQANGLNTTTIYVGQQLIIPGSGSPVQPAPRRIEFTAGATSASVTGRLNSPARDLYLVRALAGQTMRIELLSDNGVADFSLQGVSSGQVFEYLESPNSLWTGILPESQDYLIQIASLQNENPTYQLSVAITASSIPPTPAPAPITQRIQFAPGTNAATVTGSAPYPNPHNYLLHAQAGQTMRIELLSSNGVADFSLRGVSSGQILKQLQSRDSIWTGLLPGTQDYEIQVTSLDSSTPNYSLSVKIEAPLPQPTPVPSKPTPQRIHFIPGATWGGVNSSTSAARPARYVLHGLGGQTMSVHLKVDGGSAYITILKPGGIAMPEAGGELQQWTGKLPVSGDYIIEVINPGPGFTSFNLTVAIQ